MSDTDNTLVTLGILGGTGKEGSGLALRWALHGYRVIIGSRDAEKAQARAAELNEMLGGDYLTGADNVSAAAQADIVALTVPYAAHHVTLEGVRDQLEGKILIDITVPLMPPKVRTVFIPPGGAAALEAQAFLGDSVRVVSAFQNVSSEKMIQPDIEVACDVLITGNDEAAKQEVIQLVQAAGMRGFDAGPLENAVAAEALTPVLLYVGRKQGVKGVGLRLTGV
jgi:hypothetical protein